MVFAWLRSLFRVVFCPFIFVPFFSMLACRVVVRFVSSTRSTGMPMSSSIWALRFRSSLKFSFGFECMQRSMSLMLLRVVRLPKIIAS